MDYFGTHVDLSNSCLERKENVRFPALGPGHVYLIPVSRHWFIRELKQTTTTTATRTSLNKRFNEQNNSCARAL